MQLRKVGLVLGGTGALVAGTLMFSGGAIAQPEGTLRVIAVTTEQGGSGEALGDTFSFGGDIFAVGRNGRPALAAGKKEPKPIGRFGVSCVVTSVTNEEANCVGTVSLDQRRGDDGLITAQSLLSGGGDEEDATMARGHDERSKGDAWAITGGTDDFDNAGGTLITRDISETATLLVFRFAG
jgi:hypothetical protein